MTLDVKLGPPTRRVRPAVRDQARKASVDCQVTFDICWIFVRSFGEISGRRCQNEAIPTDGYAAFTVETLPDAAGPDLGTRWRRESAATRRPGTCARSATATSTSCSSWRAAKGTVIVKQALPYVRLVGDSWPLPLYRAFYEYHALTRQAARAPGIGARGLLHFRRNAGADRDGVPPAPRDPAPQADRGSGSRGWRSFWGRSARRRPSAARSCP